MSQSSGKRQVKLLVFISIKNQTDMHSRSRLRMILNIDQGLKVRPTGQNSSHGEYVLFRSVWTLNILKCEWLWICFSI